MIKIFLLLALSISVWANIGNIMAFKGEAQVKRSSDMLDATSGMVIIKGDEIVTGVKSRVQVMLKDETVVTIGSNSSFGFEDFSFGAGDAKVSMRANRGFFRSVTGEIGKIAPERFKVRTASATIGIRGTDFSGDIVGDRETFKCYSGGITVEYEGGSSDLDAGMMVELSPDKAPEVKEIAVDKEKEESEESTQKSSEKEEQSDKDAFEDVVETEIERVEIPTEDIADVTQEPDVVEEPDPVVEEPFTIDVGEEDREVIYDL